ncbi:hypothetical protein [Candidatus Borrarchaeum sp.]|uniref:hypothetical protein n=1 Tax=Candidatus Borrarchaeum sp. TaxID=2846742 RepID=UPI00257DAE42|nr:hypothetical protein [Candidatus Borrarchaeum sp.]
MEFGFIVGLSYAAKYVLKYAITNLLNTGFKRRNIKRISRLSDKKVSKALQKLKEYGLITYDRGTKEWYLSDTVRIGSDIILSKLVDITL